MICYMPFTYMTEAVLELLTGMLGPLTILQPAPDLVPAHMRQAAAQGRLELVFPQNVDTANLSRSVKTFTSWAGQHQGSDLTAFYNTGRRADALGGEAGAHKIRGQILGGRDEIADPLFQSALFLNMAHVYDQQQDALAAELNTLHGLEERFGKLLNGPSGKRTPLGADLSLDAGHCAHLIRDPTWPTAASRPGPARRRAPQPGSSFLSPPAAAVWERLLEVFPRAIVLPQLFPAHSAGQTAEGPTVLREMVARLAGAPRSGRHIV